MPVNANHTEINAEAARKDPDSVFHHYRRLIELRHTVAVVVDGDFTMVLPDHPHVYAFTRALGDEVLLVAGNFSGDDQSLDGIPDADAWRDAELVLANVDGKRAVADGLRPWEAVVWRRVG